jgi:hypothetical protein
VNSLVEYPRGRYRVALNCQIFTANQQKIATESRVQICESSADSERNREMEGGTGEQLQKDTRTLRTALFSKVVL